MASDAKTEGLACEDDINRISNFPTDLIYLIHLILEQVARTNMGKNNGQEQYGQVYTECTHD